MPPSSRPRRFMQLLVVFGALTFFVRCFDQARPYWSVINGKQQGAPQGQQNVPVQRR